MNRGQSTNRLAVSARHAAVFICFAAALAITGTAGSLAAQNGAEEATPGAHDDAAVPDSELAVELPPADLPSTNEQGYTYRIEATLTTSFDAVAQEALVYELTIDEPTEADVQALVERLRIDGEVEDLGNGTFSASGNGDLFVTSELIQYLSAAEIREGDLPSDEEAIAFAREWLRVSGLVPPDLGEGRVVSRAEETGRVLVLFQPHEPNQLLAAYPSVSVALGPNGTILEASSRWADIHRYDLYLLRPAEEAWRQVEAGQAYIEAPLEGANIPEGSEIVGTAQYTDIGIAYTTAGRPGGQQYLQPVFVFSGRLTPEGFTESYPVRAYVPALANSQAPVGAVPHAWGPA